MTTDSISLLAPINHLPAEGAELSPMTSSACGARRLLDFYAHVVADGGLHFQVTPDGIDPMEDLTPVLQYLEVRGDTEAPHLDLAGSYSDLSLPATGELPLDANATPDECVRVFLDRLNGSLQLAARGFRGRPVPLIRWQPLGSSPGAAVQCLGIWLADDEALRTFSADHGEGSLALILENPEIEGRGLREALTALAISGLIFGSLPTAEAGLFSRRAKTTPTEKAAQKSVSRLKADIDRKILARAASGHTHVLVDISKQRAYFIVNGQIAIDTPVSTARAEKYTPRGEFRITQKVRSGKTSTIYGCDLPCWMRLDDSPFGLHVGDLPGYPASAGCIRLPSNIAPLIFDHAPSGTVVKVVDSVDVNSYAKAF